MSQARWRFTVDLNVGRAVANALRVAGHDVFFVGDADPRMGDLDILRLAVQEQRIIITLDTDFGELVYRSGEPQQVCCFYGCRAQELLKKSGLSRKWLPYTVATFHNTSLSTGVGD